MTSSVRPATYETSGDMPRTKTTTVRGCMEHYTVPVMNMHERKMLKDFETAKESLVSKRNRYYVGGLVVHALTSMRIVAFGESYNSNEHRTCGCRKRNIFGDVICGHIDNFDSNRIAERAREGFCIICKTPITEDAPCAHRLLHLDCRFMSNLKFDLPNPGGQASHMYGSISQTKLLDSYFASDKDVAEQESCHVRETLFLGILRRQAEADQLRQDEIDETRKNYIQDVQVAFHMGEHKRLGENSMVHELKPDNVKLILAMVAHFAGFPPVGEFSRGEPMDLDDL